MNMNLIKGISIFSNQLEIFSLDEEGVCLVSYEETECYQVMSMFLNQKEQFLQFLLSVERENKKQDER